MLKKLLSVCLAVIMVFTLSGSVFASEANGAKTALDESLLYTESYNPAKTCSTSADQAKLERYNELISQGYELVSISSEDIDSTNTKAYDNLETRVVTSYFKQPIKTETKRGAILDFVSNVNSYVFTPLSFVPEVGWIPGLLGITSSLLSDFIARGEAEFKMISIIRFYDIDVREKGTSKYYFVASSERSEQAMTITTLGYTDNGTPFGDARSEYFVSESENYEDYNALSAIAKEYFTTGGPDYTYVYFEHYPEIETYYFE